MAAVGVAPLRSTAATPPSATASVFSASRALAIEAARTRLGLYLDEHPDGSEPAACPLAPAEVLTTATLSVAQTPSLPLQVDPWLATTATEPELRPSTAAPGTVDGLEVVTCETSRPADGALTRPALWAVSLRGGVSFEDVARRYGVEPILSVRPAAIGGEMAGSCQSTPSTRACVVLWESRNFVFGLSLEGPPAVLTPATPGRMLAAIVPGALDSMAVIVQPAPTCTSAAIAADTGVVLLGEPTCHDGWAAGVTAPCPSTGCTSAEVFHADPSGWVRDGAVELACAEDFAALGMTGVTAQEFVPACDPSADVLRGGTIRPGATGPRVGALQVALVNLGYDLPVDGRYGPLTQAAVVHYQIGAGLIVDGVAGSQTQRSLGI
jgi:hypothetical protein